MIGVQQRELYILVFESVGALSCSTNSRDLCELWYRRTWHLHHGALRILREITTGLPDFSVEHYDVYRMCYGKVCQGSIFGQ